MAVNVSSHVSSAVRSTASGKHTSIAYGPQWLPLQPTTLNFMFVRGMAGIAGVDNDGGYCRSGQ